MTYVVFTIVSEKSGVLNKTVIEIEQGYNYYDCIIKKLKETNQKNVIYMAHCFSYASHSYASHNMRPTNNDFIQIINNRL